MRCFEVLEAPVSLHPNIGQISLLLNLDGIEVLLQLPVRYVKLSYLLGILFQELLVVQLDLSNHVTFQLSNSGLKGSTQLQLVLLESLVLLSELGESGSLYHAEHL